MISQIRPGIHHLGDQIQWVSSEIAKGRTHFNVELTQGVYDLFPNITWSSEITRYGGAFELDFSCMLVRFDESKYEPCEIPGKPYVTIQFDSSKESSGEDCPERKAYVLDEDWKSWVINRYVAMGYETVDIGGKRWSLAQTAYIMKHSQGHVGAASAFCVFSRCVGTKFTHVYYNTPMREFTMLLPDSHMGYIAFSSLNGIRTHFRDPHLI